MDEKLKQRLVGAIVLISLAVIFVPMLLDGGNLSDNGEEAVPPRPEREFEPLEIPLQLPEPDANPRVIVDRPAAVDTPAPVAEAAVSQPETTPEQPAASLPAAQEPAAAEPEPEPPVVSAPPPSTNGAEAWVVQVGSFTQAANAGGLRDRLRGLGFSAFVERAGDVYRVRIGPEAEKSRAEALMARLREKTEFDGMVMRYP